MEFRIFHRQVTASTNLDARTGRPGDVFTADEQTAGRGRLDHRWLSAPGSNLMLSVVLDVAELRPEQVATLPLAVGLAVHAAVFRILGGADGDGRKVALKWPNDVYVDGRKLAGILCERNGDCVIAGVGVNVNQCDFTAELADHATSLAMVAERDFEVALVRDALLEELGSWYDLWKSEGFAALHSRYAEVDWLRGRRLAVRQTDDDVAPVTGICGGVQPDGTLLVCDTRIYAGEAHVLLNQ